MRLSFIPLSMALGRRGRRGFAEYRVPMARLDPFLWVAIAFGALVMVLTVVGLWWAGR